MTEFFGNAKFITGTIVSFVANRKMVITKDVFAEAFGLPTEGLVGFLDIPTQTVVEMLRRFSGTDVLFRAPNKKKKMKMEYRLLHDIVAKALCAKDGSFDMVTSGKFDLMVAISAGLKTNPELERQDDDASTAADQDAHVDCTNKTKIKAVTDEGAIVVRPGPEQPAQQSMTSTGKSIFAPVEIREINWHFLPKIYPSTKGKEILDAFAWLNPVEEHCLLVLKSAWEDVSNRMSDYDKWVHFRTATEQVSELLERRMLVLYKLYEMELQKRVDEHNNSFNPAEPSVNYDYMCIRFLRRDDAHVNLPQITWTEARKMLITGATPAQQDNPKILAIEFSTQSEQAQTTAKQPAQQEGQVEEIVRIVEDVEEIEAMNSQEHQAQGIEQKAQEEERQAQGSEHRLIENQIRKWSRGMSDGLKPVHPIQVQMVYIIQKVRRITTKIKQKTLPKLARSESLFPNPQADTAREIVSLKDTVSSLCLQVERINHDTYVTKHTTLQFWRQLNNKIDGLETCLIRHFANSQQHLGDEIEFLKSQVAEMVDCLKELRDAKKGEGTSNKTQ
ncbi:hypothetical protein F511_13028 [Dorcoceras hygrometricum]|uniref:Uncharacterized protein n=1 Tax=Dorcoceras hygrometricum TaxID=472368 RepID=A0A2Z7ABL4_9LAMI|nr:hypothetical protein F511_13028 [Dorcoceras hygrometricum]